MSLLQMICEEQRQLVNKQRSLVSLDMLRRENKLYEAPTRSLKAALAKEGLSIIAEHKRASPSEGEFGVSQSPSTIAKAYETASASAISVLTEAKHFGGSLNDLREIRGAVELPLLRKDFLVSAYQLHEAKAYGADAVLLIAAALSLEMAEDLRVTAHHIGLEVLLEVHDAAELDYLVINPDVVGVNNRNLATLAIDLSTSKLLRPLLPNNLKCISESGITSAKDGEYVRELGFDGALIGSQFMKTANPGEQLAKFLEAVNNPKTMPQ